MGPGTMFDVIRRRWLLVGLTTLFVLGIANVLTLLTPKTYTANSQLFVSVRDSSPSAGDLVSGNTYAQSQVRSYVGVVTAPVVLQPVINELDLNISPDDLAQRVGVSVPEQTSLIDIAVTDSDPQRASTINNQIVEEFSLKISELERASASRSQGQGPVSISVLRPGTAPDKATSPNPLRNVLVGAALGLLLGIGAAILRESTDRSVTTKEDLEAVTDLPLIGHIPFDPQTSDHPVVDLDEHSPRAEALRTLRTNLQFVLATKPRGSVVFTSSLPGEGKSTTVANVAHTLAALGAKVCIVEADMRRPKLMEYLGLPGSAGVTDVLVGAAELDDVLQDFGQTDLTVLSAGRVPPNPSELLGSAKMEHVLSELEARFDYVLIDAPPLLAVTDAAVVSRLATGTVLIVGSGIVERDEVSASLAALQAVDSEVLGIILNRAGDAPFSTRSGYYYSQRAERARQPEPQTQWAQV